MMNCYANSTGGIMKKLGIVTLMFTSLAVLSGCSRDARYGNRDEDIGRNQTINTGTSGVADINSTAGTSGATTDNVAMTNDVAVTDQNTAPKKHHAKHKVIRKQEAPILDTRRDEQNEIDNTFYSNEEFTSNRDAGDNWKFGTSGAGTSELNEDQMKSESQRFGTRGSPTYDTGHGGNTKPDGTTPRDMMVIF
jgi:hypothetical protein